MSNRTNFPLCDLEKKVSCLDRVLPSMDIYHPDQIALTGGTGALGLAFLKRIFSENKTVQARLLVRRSSRSFLSPEFQNWWLAHQDRVTLIDADIRHLSEKDLAALLGTDGGIWHFAALTSLTAGNSEVAREIHEINADATARLVQAASDHPRPGPFYHISTAYVAGKREGQILENDKQKGQEFRNPYEAAKLQAELSVEEGFASGLRGAIFRPSIVVDNRTGSGGLKAVDACAYAVALSLKRSEPFIFRLKETAQMNLVHSDWVIAALLDLARLPSAQRQTYHLTTPQTTTWQQIVIRLHQLVTGLRISFQPDAPRRSLPTASRLFDKAITDVRSYFEADISFDRTNTERDINPKLKEIPIDLHAFVRKRLETELALTFKHAA